MPKIEVYQAEPSTFPLRSQLGQEKKTEKTKDPKWGPEEKALKQAVYDRKLKLKMWTKKGLNETTSIRINTMIERFENKTENCFFMSPNLGEK